MGLMAIEGFSSMSTSQGCSYAHKKKYYPEEAPVKTIVLDNGDVIDCVDFCSQPAMRDPNIRRNPQLRARRAENKSHDDWTNEKLSGSRVERWSCPQGSVPFLKATKAGPLNLSAVEDFARSRAQFFPESNTAKPQADPDNRLFSSFYKRWRILRSPRNF
ncbi:hypothetical protein EJ110_NYTH21245 [Nymphaea thermarum]|nr:hypothetical protein EJ110_NYTH21245 [Nymphaea thermarum]